MELLLRRMLPRFSDVLTSYLRRNQYNYLFFTCCAEFTYAYQKYLIAERLRSVFNTQNRHTIPIHPAWSPIALPPKLVKHFVDEATVQLASEKGAHNSGRLDGILYALQASINLMVELESLFPTKLWHREQVYRDSVLLIFECIICLQFDLTLENYTGVPSSSLQTYRLDHYSSIANCEEIIEQLKVQLKTDNSLAPRNIGGIINYLYDELTVARTSRFVQDIRNLQRRQDYKDMVAEGVDSEASSINSPLPVNCEEESGDEESMVWRNQYIATPSVVGSVDTPEELPRYESFSQISRGMMLPPFTYSLLGDNSEGGRHAASESGSSAHGSRICRPAAPAPSPSPSISV